MSDNGKFFGKYRGMVLNNIDPLQTGRLLVQVPDVTNVLPSSWAMPCLPFAGIQHGFFAVPAIGSTVWVEFEHGNPDHPIWTGCFWETAAQVPAPALAAPPGLQQIVIQTVAQNTMMISDVPGPTGGILLKSTTGAFISVSEIGITISNGQGATIVMTGPSVTVNEGALEVIQPGGRARRHARVRHPLSVDGGRLPRGRAAGTALRHGPVGRRHHARDVLRTALGHHGRNGGVRARRNTAAANRHPGQGHRDMNIAFPYAFDATGHTAQADPFTHVSDMIEQVLFTSPGERVNRPTFGSGTAQLVFTPSSDVLAAAQQQAILAGLQQWLSDLIQVQSVTVAAEESTLQVTVVYTVIQSQQQLTEQFVYGSTSS